MKLRKKKGGEEIHNIFNGKTCKGNCKLYSNVYWCSWTWTAIFCKLYEVLSWIIHIQIFTFSLDIFLRMNAKMCTEAEGYKLIAIVISTQLQPTLKLSCIRGKRERNTTTNGDFPGFYHCVKTLSFCNHCLSCKIAQMQQNPDAKCFFKHQLSDSKEQDEALRHYWSFQQAAIPGGTSNLSVGVPFIPWGERLSRGSKDVLGKAKRRTDAVPQEPGTSLWWVFTSMKWIHGIWNSMNIKTVYSVANPN